LPGFDSWQCKIFLFSTAFRPTLVPTHPIQWAMVSGKMARPWNWTLTSISRKVQLYLHSPIRLHGTVLN
jgi:hypothetical protein